MNGIYKHITDGFSRAAEQRETDQRRIGAELKFPMVNADGSAVNLETYHTMLRHLTQVGWSPVKDKMTGKVVAARKPGPMNDTVAACETGFCKPEFSLAHEPDLFSLRDSVRRLREELEGFSRKNDVYFLGYGIQPVSRPSQDLMMKQTRTSVWDKVFGANRCIPERDGDDVCLFTVNSASHVHVSVSRAEAVDAVNALGGFTGAQIALTANSSVWKNRVDPDYKCAAEKFWDWWMEDHARVGIPSRPFEDLEDYSRAIGSFRPVYVKRDGMPIILKDYETFHEYYASDEAVGYDTEGNRVRIKPQKADVDLHFTCYWHNARISRYYTVENRANDQQPPSDMLCIAAITLGLIASAREAAGAIRDYSWEKLQKTRPAACSDGLTNNRIDPSLEELAGRMLELAETGLKSRGLGEEEFLEPLWRRLKDDRCPADEAAEVFGRDGAHGLIENRAL